MHSHDQSLTSLTSRRRRRAKGSGCTSHAIAALLATLMVCTGSAVMAANAAAKQIQIKAMPLANALMEYGAQSGLTVVAPTRLTAGKTSAAISGKFAPNEALTRLLQGSGLTFKQAANGVITIEADGPAKVSAAAASGDATSATTSNENQNQLTEVIVTALRRSQNLLDVPAPVTALQSAYFIHHNAFNLASYVAAVPGLNLVTTQPGQTVVIMQGITTGWGAASAPTTAVYVDDTPVGSETANALGNLTTLDLDPSTLERVEVLRGPQGTLYGANAMGGLIKYVTIAPSLTTYTANVGLGGSAVDGGGEGYRVSASVNGPLITDKLGVIINAYDHHYPGYIHDSHLDSNNVNQAREDGGRVAFLWRPNDRFSADLSTLVQDNTTNGTSDVDLNYNLTPIYGKYQQLRYGNETWDYRILLSSLRAIYHFDWATLTSITSYQEERAAQAFDFSNRFGPLLSSILGIPNLGVFDHVHEDEHKITQEVRLASSNSGSLEWLGGLFFTHENSVQPEKFADPFSTVTGVTVPVPGGIFTDPNHDSFWEYAGYADLTYHFTPKFKILVGGRFTHDRESNVTPFSGLLNGPPAIAIISTSSSTATYLFSPSYNFTNHQMVYLRVASGFRPGGPTGLTTTSVFAGAPATYGPDTLVDYELGYKAGLPVLRMTIDVDAFNINWKKMQVLTETPQGFVITGNAGSSTSRGVEATWTWRPINRLNLSANAAYTHAYLTSDAPGIGGVAGDRLPDVPEFSANVSADYHYPVTANVDGFVGANYQYQGARIIDFVSGAPAGYVRPAMPAYDLVDLRAGLSRGGLTGQLYVKNVGNSYGINHLVSEVQDGYSAPLAGALIQPRTFGFSINYKF